jgi:hypothetical protein
MERLSGCPAARLDNRSSIWATKRHLATTRCKPGREQADRSRTRDRPDFRLVNAIARRLVTASLLRHERDRRVSAIQIELRDLAIVGLPTKHRLPLSRTHGREECRAVALPVGAMSLVPDRGLSM